MIIKKTNPKFHESRIALTLKVLKQMTFIKYEREKLDFPQKRLIVFRDCTVVPAKPETYYKKPQQKYKDSSFATNVHRITS